MSCPPASRGRASSAICFRNPTIAIGGFLLLLLVFVAVFAPFLWTKDPTALAPAMRTRAPSERWWFGTDMLGRDVYSRVLYGTRVSLTVGFGVAFFLHHRADHRPHLRLRALG
jgi:peptide/nickel transport system permease protein